MTDATTFFLRPPSRQTLTETITESLREAIFCRGFHPGQRVAEAQLAKRLEVSRAPIREALAVLEQEGLVRRTPAGTFVTELSHADVLEICTLRHALELLAMRLALAQSDATWRDSLADNIERTREAVDPTQLARLDLEFHEIIVRAAHHQRLLSSWLKLRSQVRLIMTQRNLTDARSRAGTIRAHGELLAAMGAKDIALPVTLLERHLQSQCEWIMGSFDEVKTEPSLPAVGY
jgi:DNA-binding GntR family transcriptional regulator